MTQEKFKLLNVRRVNDIYLPHKPLLLLVALSNCSAGGERLRSFLNYEKDMQTFIEYFDDLRIDYPFCRLVNDEIWEIEDYNNLKKNISGDISRNELINKNIKGGFDLKTYTELQKNISLPKELSSFLIEKYFTRNKQILIKNLLELHPSQNKSHIANSNKKISSEPYKTMEAIFNTNITVNGTHDYNFFGEKNMQYQYDIPNNTKADTIKSSNYISYLNSLHNISADGSNALAESQALSEYFGDLYIPFEIAETIKNSLSDNEDMVIILTGHAGDGKSTVALDVYKHLMEINPHKPLQQQLKEEEIIHSKNRNIHIIKDMSELSAEQRISSLDSAIGKSGSWLIISNTGPLLNSFTTLANKIGIVNPGWLENEILKKLDIPYENTIKNFDAHTLAIENIKKPIVFLNMTRLNNVNVGSKVLEKILSHPGWKECTDCDIFKLCPLQANRNALLTSQVIERVRWIYQRITAYEQRLTMRQIVAHLAFSMTGGLNCEDARKHVLSASLKDAHGLGEILFSESFFGFQRGIVHKAANELRAIALIQRLEFGNPFSVDFERKLDFQNPNDLFTLSPELLNITSHWQNYANGSSGIRWRFALRRIVYLYGQSIKNTASLNNFFNHFLMAPRLRDFDRWSTLQKLDFTDSELRNFKNTILKVLLGIYSGFNVGQFSDSVQKIYLTLRRPDKTIVQATQVVIASPSYSEFSITFDKSRCIPCLSYLNGLALLPLSLPLLDYIQLVSEGNLGNQLAPIHLAQLDCFRASLIRAAPKKSPPNDELSLLRAGIDGSVKSYHYYLDRNNNTIDKA